MVSAFNRTQKRLWRLDRNYKVLANQRLILETLSLAMQVGYGAGDWYDKADGLLKEVAAWVYETCHQIAVDSSPDLQDSEGEQ